MEEQEGELSVWLVQEPPEAPIEEPTETKEPTARRAARIFAFLVTYLSLLLPITFGAFLIPSAILFRGDYVATATYWDDWIQVWPWSTFVVWVACMVAGYSFVAYVTEKRQNPFKSRFDKYQCFLRLIVKAPLVYLCGPVRSLYGPTNTDHLPAFLFNSLFLLFFFVGLQFTYLDSVTLFRRAGDKFGTPSLWRTYTRTELALIIPIIFGIVGCIAWQLYLIWLYTLIVWYSVFYGIVFLALILPTIIFRKTHHLHLHHYAIFGLLIPFFAFQNPFSLACLGVVTGVYVEGVSRWGMAWFWYPGAQREYIN